MLEIASPHFDVSLYPKIPTHIIFFPSRGFPSMILSQSSNIQIMDHGDTWKTHTDELIQRREDKDLS